MVHLQMTTQNVIVGVVVVVVLGLVAAALFMRDEKRKEEDAVVRAAVADTKHEIAVGKASVAAHVAARKAAAVHTAPPSKKKAAGTEAKVAEHERMKAEAKAEETRKAKAEADKKVAEATNPESSDHGWLVAKNHTFRYKSDVQSAADTAGKTRNVELSDAKAWCDANDKCTGFAYKPATKSAWYQSASDLWAHSESGVDAYLAPRGKAKGAQGCKDNDCWETA